MADQEPKEKRSLSWVEILVILVIVVAIVVVIVPVHITVPSERSKRLSALSNVRSIVIACRAFESEWGSFPDFDPKASDSGEPPEVFSSSTEVFNLLIPATSSCPTEQMSPQKVKEIATSGAKWHGLPAIHGSLPTAHRSLTHRSPK